MKRYYFTFGQIHTHPETGINMKDYYVIVKAINYQTATAIFRKKYGLKYAFVYTENDFRKEYFPLGCYEIMEK